ncbi:MAG: hypothetical protein E6J18_16365, partial [Chloroflexi bacterium]
AAVSLVLVGCAERVNAPTAARPGAPSFEIRDGAHNNGNPHFYFLPPIVASPNATGSFDATQAPSVTVCQLASSGCPVIAQFSMTTGTGSAVVRVDAASQSYVVNWQTDQCVTGPCTLPSGNVYRIRVLVASTELGHADVQVVVSQQEAKNVNTGEFFPLVDGRTLPVKFRIEQGAVFVAGPSSQPLMIQTPVSAAGSSVQLVIPGGALSQPTGITVLPAMLSSGTSTSALVGGTAYDFGPTGTMFASPVAVMMQYSPAQLPAGTAESTLRLFTLMNGRWLLVPGSRVNSATHMVMGMTSHFSTYGVLASASVSAGDAFSCGVGTSGTTVCWGDNGVGQLGNGTTGGINVTPGLVSAPAGVSFSAVSVGPAHACGLTSGGAAYCWGGNPFGELGNGTRTNSPVPLLVNEPGVAFSEISMAENSSCGVDSNGAAYCWGIYHGSILTTPQPIAGVTFSTVSVGGLFLLDSAVACGIAGGIPFCWGSNGVGAVGSGSANFMEPTPVAVAYPVGDSLFTVVSVGGKDYQFVCGVSGTTGIVYCWGGNGTGQLGVGSVGGSSFTPAPITAPAGVSFTTVSAGGFHACAVATTGSVYCWGSNSNGQLGDGTAIDSPTPVEVYAPGVSFSAVSAGRYHTCAVTNAPPNTAYCWGANSSGQLGNGTTVDQLTPVAVSTIP